MRAQIKYSLIIALLLPVSTIHAQTWSEWFRQKKTQRKYLVQQIIKLQLYLEYVKKGYAIVNEGLTIVGDIKSGDFRQHAGYFDRLEKVNPATKEYVGIDNIATTYRQIIATCKHFYSEFKTSGDFPPGELAYIDKVFNAVLDDVDTEYKELARVLFNDTYVMTDPERVKRLEILKKSLEDKREFLLTFCRQTQASGDQRSRELRNIRKLQQLYQP
ncbi:MAG: hypothetical protein J0I32_09665 [Sphingobacteriales bacterium]|nr:hypothetical protein [Sphingobacteriales bacterium]OJW00267.1 MAG: hypothetical protein BGO52_04040 [Sphingobacteriales bacterium 44-61]